MADAPRGGVVLLHGHGRRAASLNRLARVLSRDGYATLLPSYRYRTSLTEIVDALEPRVADFDAATPGPLHFVTHSLGGLVARALITRRPPGTTGRTVMLAPPNGGSELTDLAFRLRVDRLLLGQTGHHLRTARLAADEALLGEATSEIGIIAGCKAIDPLFPRLLLPRPNDGKVLVAATRLAGAADHIVVPVSHTLMVYSPVVFRHVRSFLDHGAFDRGALCHP